MNQSNILYMWKVGERTVRYSEYKGNYKEIWGQFFFLFFFFQAKGGIRDFCLSRGLGDVYKGQEPLRELHGSPARHVFLSGKASFLNSFDRENRQC